MVSCANITLEKIRARILFGSLIFETPDVKSFSVTKSRSSLPATFNCSIEVPVTTIFPTDQDLIIEAGTIGNLQRLITGNVLSITVNPSFEDAASYVVNLSGADRFQELEGKTISRRQRTRGAAMFAAITGVSSKAPQRGTSLELRKQSGGSNRVANRDTNIREHSKLVRTDRVAWDPFGTAKRPTAGDQSEDEGSDIIDIKPKSIALSPGVSALFTAQNTTVRDSDTWSVSDTNIGVIVKNDDGTATYTQIALGENDIILTKSGNTSFVGRATAVGIPIHDHSSLGAGGPAFGIYGSD